MWLASHHTKSLPYFICSTPTDHPSKTRLGHSHHRSRRRTSLLQPLALPSIGTLSTGSKTPLITVSRCAFGRILRTTVTLATLISTEEIPSTGNARYGIKSPTISRTLETQRRAHCIAPSRSRTSMNHGQRKANLDRSSAPLLRRHLECPSTSPYGEGGSPCVSSPTNMSAPCKKCGGIDGNHCVGCEN